MRTYRDCATWTAKWEPTTIGEQEEIVEVSRRWEQEWIERDRERDREREGEKKTYKRISGGADTDQRPLRRPSSTHRVQRLPYVFSTKSVRKCDLVICSLIVLKPLFSWEIFSTTKMVNMDRRAKMDRR